MPDPNFGEDGFVDLRDNFGKLEFEIDNITHGAPPIAVGDSVIIGSKFLITHCIIGARQAMSSL